MDLLKRELEKKRKAATADFGGKSFVRRSELEQKQLQKRRDEHRQLLAKASASATSADFAADATGSDTSNPDAAAQAAAANPNPSSSSASSAPSVPPALAPKKTTQEEALLSEERRIDELDLPRHEVVRRLRVLREPVTLFGEDDDARLARFKLVLKSGVIDDIDDIDMTEGQTNDFLRDMIEMRKRQKAGRDTYAKGKGKRVGGGDGGDGGAAGDSADDGDAKGSGDDADADKDSKRMRTKFEELCNEDKILVFFKKLLNEWNQELDEMTELEKRTAKGKSMVATFKQCARYLSPLFEFCRKKKGSRAMVRALRKLFRVLLHAFGSCGLRILLRVPFLCFFEFQQRDFFLRSSQKGSRTVVRALRKLFRVLLHAFGSCGLRILLRVPFLCFFEFQQRDFFLRS